MTFFRKRVLAFNFAFNGIWLAFRQETHLKFHLAVAILVVIAGFVYHISRLDWFMILSCIALVMSLEMINSALEKLCDRLVPENDDKIKYVKDVAAGAVLIACIFALVIAIMVFTPYLEIHQYK